MFLKVFASHLGNMFHIKLSFRKSIQLSTEGQGKGHRNMKLA